ncbi:hypothetical protein RAB80_004245 [Fusarium oxysporum f. sp. vasinfectum]|uniref:Uncharacterized protein n=1 Tax=Fusarium oxysporum f. sp. vasinfectum 25433 TaxID=1089449 RepID=X0MQ74_FUSOX|nr:hypothetical protein FOTG_00060 [Fusarium oxysporum f. sp. vasinfectum 25433]KAK2679064.1 hypothetical protein RAB80_004245 [Fusarium oxysporum f. sp. vasinfectum]
MEREYSTVPWSDLDFIRELRPAIKVPYKPKQCKKFLAELSIASVDGIDAKGGSKSDNKSENKFDTTGFLHDTSLSSYDEQPGVLVFKPLFKQPSFGRWVQMEVKVTESETGVNGDSEDTKYYPVGEVWIGHEYEAHSLQRIAKIKKIAEKKSPRTHIDYPNIPQVPLQASLLPRITHRLQLRA